MPPAPDPAAGECRLCTVAMAAVAVVAGLGLLYIGLDMMTGGAITASLSRASAYAPLAPAVDAFGDPSG